MAHPFSSVDVVPSYSRGFRYSWEIAGDFNDPGPWAFVVQEGMSDKGPWKNLSPEIVNFPAWEDGGGIHKVGKSNVLYFRIRLKTPRGTYFSPVLQPYGTLGRRDFLLAREIMRREALRAKVMSGVKCRVYVRSTFGPRCSKCLDPDTGQIRDSHCRYCFGTGRNPAFMGPYSMWMSFSTDAAHTEDDDNTGTHEAKSFEALAIGNPVLKRGDLVIDSATDKRYLIEKCDMAAEVRRVPCLQRITISEAPIGDVIYKVEDRNAG